MARENEYEANKQRRQELQIEINQHKVVIDRLVFRKSAEEKLVVKAARLTHKRLLKK